MHVSGIFRPISVALLFAAAALCACGGGSGTPAPIIVPPSSRFLAVTANTPSEPPGDANAALDLVYNSGSRGQYLFFTWRDLEPAAEAYDFADLDGLVQWVTSRGFQQILVTIAPINSFPKETPPDLLDVPFNAPEMKSRFRALLDAVRSHLPSSVAYLSIGNEVDLRMALNPGEWQPYSEFYADAVSYAHQIMPARKIGVTVTFDGAMGAEAANVSSLIAPSDILVFTYYPLGAELHPRPPTSPSVDFPRMRSLAGTRPVALQEVGFPSSTQLASSEALQAEFVTNVFQTWNTTASQMPFVNFFLLHDFSQSACDQFAAYYGFPADENLKAFLCSIGLRHVNGTSKAAWQAFVDGAARMNP